MDQAIATLKTVTKKSSRRDLAWNFILWATFSTTKNIKKTEINVAQGTLQFYTLTRLRMKAYVQLSIF